MPRAKGTKTRNDEQILNEKANRIGNILERQIVNLKKMQRNAIKSGNIEKYNKMVSHFSDKISGLEIDATIETTDESEGFDINKLE